MGLDTLEISVENTKRAKNEFPQYDLAIPFPGTWLKRYHIILHRYLFSHVYFQSILNN